MMEEYLNKEIKKIITEFPPIADILNEYNIGCVPCNVGSCFLKDIVEIHNLSLKQEQELLNRIAKVIYPVRNIRDTDKKSKISNGVYPEREIKIPRIQKKPPVKPGEIKYSPPIKKLVDEHVLIKKWIALIPEVIENLDIIKTMLSDHQTARNHVKAIMEALQEQDKEAIIEHLNGYKELLTEHIKKEDEILYPWIDRNLNITWVGELFQKFQEADKKTGEVVLARCEKFIKNLEEKIRLLKK